MCVYVASIEKTNENQEKQPSSQEPNITHILILLVNGNYEHWQEHITKKLYMKDW